MDMSKSMRILPLIIMLGILAGCTRSVPGSDSALNLTATPGPEAVSEAGVIRERVQRLP